MPERIDPGVSGAAFRESLAQHRQLIVAPVGWSMFPLLRPYRDAVVLEAVDRPLKRYDVALYERSDGKLVLHRVVRAAADGYAFRGDGATYLECDVRKTQLCARMTGFFKGARYVRADAPLCRLYARLWCAWLLPRRAALWLLKKRQHRKDRLGGR